MIKKYSLKALETAINQALALDDSSQEKISALDGKVLEIIVAPLDINFFICFDQQKMQLLAEYTNTADTIIHSSPLGLIRLSLLPASKARSLFNDKIRLSGDIELGQQVKQLFDELEIDWEGHLAHFTGDVVAHQVGSIFRKGLSFKNQLSSSLRHSIKDYLQAELNLFPPREEIEDFCHDVDTLALDVERLQAQFNQVLKHYEID